MRISSFSREFVAAILAVCALGVGCSDVEELHDVAYDDRFERGRMDVYLPGTAAPTDRL